MGQRRESLISSLAVNSFFFYCDEVNCLVRASLFLMTDLSTQKNREEMIGKSWQFHKITSKALQERRTSFSSRNYEQTQYRNTLPQIREIRKKNVSCPFGSKNSRQCESTESIQRYIKKKAQRVTKKEPLSFPCPRHSSYEKFFPVLCHLLYRRGIKTLPWENIAFTASFFFFAHACLKTQRSFQSPKCQRLFQMEVSQIGWPYNILKCLGNFQNI